MESYKTTFTIKRLWLILAAAMFVMFAILLFVGREIYHQAPPIPASFTTTAGDIVFTADDIRTGQNVWQSLGGMQQGSVWGHGGYLAPDWTADWLHREANILLDIISARDALVSRTPIANERDLHEVTLRNELRENTYDPNTGVATMGLDRAKVTYASVKHYYAYARSAEFMHSTIMEVLVWARVPGDVVFAIGVFALAAFVYQAFTRSSHSGGRAPG